ncbi:hypothetical protein JHK82_043223 [Glycine max]|nr:hypothetical protein JHK82_043223 [Glycine max]
MKNSSSSSTQRKCAFARKCARLVKEQRARFYILRRYVFPSFLRITFVAVKEIKVFMRSVKEKV